MPSDFELLQLEAQRPLRGDPPNGTLVSPRPRLDASDHDLRKMKDQAWIHIVEANRARPWLFRFGGVPMRADKDEDGQTVLRQLTPERLRHESARATDWYRPSTNGDLKSANPPLAVMTDMLACPDVPLPVLKSVTHGPSFTVDGRLLDRTGYDKASGLFTNVIGLGMPRVPLEPTTNDCARARTLICDDLLGDFPFASESDRAHAVGLLVQLYARDLIEGYVPLHLFEAPTIGSGKTLCAQAILYSALGRPVSPIVEAENDHEWRKRLSACFLNGRPVVFLDNLAQPLESPSLAAALTSSRWSDRLLGRNELIDVPVRCHWVATANNPVLSMEIARRTIRIRLDPKVERPWQRSGFRHSDLQSWVAANRAQLIWSACVLIRAWLVARRPVPSDLKPMASYEDWTRVIGGILAQADIPGFLGNVDEFYSAVDYEGAYWRELVAEWWDQYKSATVRTADLISIAENIDGFPLGQTKEERGRRTALGVQLGQKADCIIGGYRIVRAGSVRRANQWQLIPSTTQIPDACGDTEVVKLDEDGRA